MDKGVWLEWDRLRFRGGYWPGLWWAGQAGERVEVGWQDLACLVLFGQPGRKELGLILHTFPEAFWKILIEFLKKIATLFLLHLLPFSQEKKEEKQNKNKRNEPVRVPRRNLTLHSYPGLFPVENRKDSILRIVPSGLSLELSLPLTILELILDRWLRLGSFERILTKKKKKTTKIQKRKQICFQDFKY